MRTPSRVMAVLVASVCLGCHTNFGARTVEPARFDYNQAIARSWDQQQLLNLVRLRYRDTTVFLEVGSVVTQHSYSGDASLGSFDLERGEGGLVGSGVEYSETPTISYTPLKGKEFVTRVLSPLAPESLILLGNSGWSVQRLMMCCVHRINGIENAPSAAGPTPDGPPDYQTFSELSGMLRVLQKAKALQINLVDGSFVMRLAPTGDRELERIAARVRRLMHLSAEVQDFRVVSAYQSTAPDEIALVGRSLLGVFFYLSQGVKPPAEHEEQGLVTVTRGDDGRLFDWWQAMDGLLRVHASKEKPERAFVKVPYRGHWFYVDDADLESKTTFSLLTYLFSIQASGSAAGSPLLTLSASG